MRKLICVDRQRDNHGKIVNYIVMDIENGQYKELTAQNVKDYLINGGTQIVNLKLSSDNRILLINDKIQNKVDEINTRYKNNIFVMNTLEAFADNVIEKLVEYSDECRASNKLIKLRHLNTYGDVNSLQLCVNNSKLNKNNCIIILRYRKNIVKLEDNTCKLNIEIGIVGIKTSTNMIKFNKNKVYRTKSIYYGNTRRSSLSLIEEWNRLIKFIAKACDDECTTRNIRLNNMDNFKNNLIKIGIQSAAVAMISISCIGLVGCGNTTYASTGKDTAIEAVQSTKTYTCDYKTLALNTKITTNIGDKNVTIKGNIFRLVTDPLKMVDDDDNVLAEATDSYNFISEDDHAILVNGVVDVVMSGNFDFIGKSYKLYDKDGNHIGNFERNKLTSMGAKITDIDGNIIAEYSRGLMMNDFEVTINENDKMSDEAVLMIMSSFVSDQKYEDSSNSSISFGDSD